MIEMDTEFTMSLLDPSIPESEIKPVTSNKPRSRPLKKEASTPAKAGKRTKTAAARVIPPIAAAGAAVVSSQGKKDNAYSSAFGPPKSLSRGRLSKSETPKAQKVSSAGTPSSPPQAKPHEVSGTPKSREDRSPVTSPSTITKLKIPVAGARRSSAWASLKEQVKEAERRASAPVVLSLDSSRPTTRNSTISVPDEDAMASQNWAQATTGTKGLRSTQDGGSSISIFPLRSAQDSDENTKRPRAESVDSSSSSPKHIAQLAKDGEQACILDEREERRRRKVNYQKKRLQMWNN